MVDIKHGQSSNAPASTERLGSFFKSQVDLNGKLYIGYPILYTGGESITLDALWISNEYGIIAFDLVEGTQAEDRTEYRDELYSKLYSLLHPYKQLNIGRNLAVNIEVITYAPACSNIKFDLTATDNASLVKIITERDNWEHPELIISVISVLQSIVKIKTNSDRRYVKLENSRGAIIKLLEETIANLDSQQESAIIEYKGGIQRIRGLAGSGKTIVLALKAAYLHATNSDLDIVVTFNTRALKNQFIDLVELFCIQKTGRKPNFDKIRIMQAWGSPSSTGVYYEFCKTNGVIYHDYRSMMDKEHPFDAACKESFGMIKQTMIKELYDVILVDEAQDLSENFLNMAYTMLRKDAKGKKNLIYAYDELQKLSVGYSLRSPKSMFGVDDMNDIILKKCYRNSRPLLTTAHALGFGIYRDKGLVQFFDQPELWEDLGYHTSSGSLRKGDNVVLSRKDEATHKFIEDNVNIEDLIIFKSFPDKETQAERVAEDIIKNLTQDELLYNDIIVINPIALTTKSEVSIIRAILFKKGFKTHITGASNSDVFFETNSIAFTGINRAKGNEVPMVYIINADECYSHPMLADRDLQRRRNILFTAMTRSKAWVRVYGCGKRMEALINEYERVKSKEFVLDFTYPSQEEIDDMNTIRRDISDDEFVTNKKEIDQLSELLPSIIQKIDSGEMSIEDYPAEMQPILKLLISK